MDKYKHLNVLNTNNLNKDFMNMSDDAIQDLANIINTSGLNRAQRKALSRKLDNIGDIYGKAKKDAQKKIYKEYKSDVDKNMVRFFAILGIAMIKNYGWKNEEGCEQVEELFDILLTYLREYREYSTEQVASICEDVTDIILVSKPD